MRNPWLAHESHEYACAQQNGRAAPSGQAQEQGHTGPGAARAGAVALGPGLWCESTRCKDRELVWRDHLIHGHTLVLWLEDGPTLHVHRDGRRYVYSARRGKLDFYPCGPVEFAHVTGGMRALLIHIGRQWDEDLLLASAALGRGLDLQFGEPRLREIATLAQRMAQGDRPFGPTFEAYLARALVARLHERAAVQRRGAAGGGFKEPTRRLLTEVIDRSLGERISVEMLSALVGCGPLVFMRAFRASFGLPAHRYLLQQRIERACEYLRDPARPLTEIALSVGFSSGAHFSAAFRVRHGCSPSAYRRALQAR